MGLGLSPPPWGFAVAYYSPMTESGNYLSPLTGHALDTEVSIKEYRFTLANGSLFDGGLALGATFELAEAVRELGALRYNRLALSYQLGALWRFPRHIVVGASFKPMLAIGPASRSGASR